MADSAYRTLASQITHIGSARLPPYRSRHFVPPCKRGPIADCKPSSRTTDLKERRRQITPLFKIIGRYLKAHARSFHRQLDVRNIDYLSVLVRNARLESNWSENADCQ